MTTAFALFETEIGHCGVVWSERGVVAVQLPENTATKTRMELRQRFVDATEGSPTGKVAHAVKLLTALLAGKMVELSGIELDFEGLPAFTRRVYEQARVIPAGSVVSYGELATRLGSPRAARAVGQALGRNPWPLIVPCHRVLAANGKLTGFSAPGGIATKRRLLSIEGVRTKPNASVPR